LEQSEYHHDKLKTVCIHHINIKDDKILPSLFSLIPSLETLDLDDRFSTAPFISTEWPRRLSVTLESGSNSELDEQALIESAPVLPRLQQLSLKTQVTNESHIHCPIPRQRTFRRELILLCDLRVETMSLSSVEFILEGLEAERAKIQPLVDLALEARGKIRVTFIDQSGSII
jgi:hypothetical protein